MRSDTSLAIVTPADCPRLVQMTARVRHAAGAILVGAALAWVPDASAFAAAAAATTTPAQVAKADKPKRPLAKLKPFDLSPIATAPGMMAEPAAILQPRHDERGALASNGRKVQLKGLGVQYQVNRATAIESGVRLDPNNPGAFIRVERKFGAKKGTQPRQ